MDDAELIRRAAIARGQPPRYSWDEACTRGLSYQGYGLDELLRRLLVKEAKATCSQCGAGDCTHEAARLVLLEVQACEHMPSPPEPPLTMPKRGNRHELALFRFGLLFGGSLGMTIGILIATAIAFWSIYHSLPAAVADALRHL